ncbi:uncharacterized protein LOC123693455 isoform X2 [Colias croceus]|uniref:uncharacterized protein LOC123693455 isoform X2 n=1 Tax=Colias crocea TaxID=72248 RepID=UPI001E27AAE7|nr:uncharacterized protein LOC123693455 isoform X2 [Colias croceus]
MDVVMSDVLPLRIKELVNVVQKSDPADVEDALPGWVRRCLLHLVTGHADSSPEKSTYWNDKPDLLIQTFLESLQTGIWGDGSVLTEVLLSLLEKKSVELLLSDYCETYLDTFATVSEGIGFTNSQLSATKLEEFLRFSKKYKIFFEKFFIENNQTNNKAASASDVIAKRLTDRLKAGFKDTKFYWQTLSKAIVNNIESERQNRGKVFKAIEIHILILKFLKANNEIVICNYKSGFEDFLNTTCNAYFLQSDNKNMEAAVLGALLSFYVDLQNIDGLLTKVKDHGLDSLYSVYDKVVRAWLESEAASRCLVDLVFELAKFFTEEELDLMFKSFEKLPLPVVQWCTSAGLSLPHCSGAAARWLRADLLERTLGAPEARPRRLAAIKIILECLARDETLLTASAIDTLLSPNVTLVTDCPALALSLLLHTFELHLTVQVGDNDESARRRQQCAEACAARARLPHRAAGQFARGAAAALQRRLALLEYPYDEIFVNHLAELSFYITDYFNRTTENDTIGEIHEILFENPTDYKCSTTVRTFALVKDCILGLLNCPTEAEDESLGFRREGIMPILDGNEEIYLRKKDIEIFSRNVLFRGLYLLKAASNIDKAKDFARGAWSPAVRRLVRACADLARDFAVLHSLHEVHPDSAYFTYTTPLMPFDDILQKGKNWALRFLYKIEKEGCKDFFVSVVKLLTDLSNKYGYYYAYARAHTVFEVAKRAQKDFLKKEYIQRTFYDKDESEFKELIQSNGYFHSIQMNATDTASEAGLTRCARAARVVAARTAALRLWRRQPGADLPDDPRHPACHSALPDGRASDMEWEAILSHSSLLWYVYYKDRSTSMSELLFSIAAQPAVQQALAALAREPALITAKVATLALPTFRIVKATYYHSKREGDAYIDSRLRNLYKLVGEVYLNILRFGTQNKKRGGSADELCICEALTTDALLKLAEILAIEPDLSPLKRSPHLEAMPAELRAAALAALGGARPALQHVAYRALDMLAARLLQQDVQLKKSETLSLYLDLLCAMRRKWPAIVSAEESLPAPAVSAGFLLTALLALRLCAAAGSCKLRDRLVRIMGRHRGLVADVVRAALARLPARRRCAQALAACPVPSNVTEPRAMFIADPDRLAQELSTIVLGCAVDVASGGVRAALPALAPADRELLRLLVRLHFGWTFVKAQFKSLPATYPEYRIKVTKTARSVECKKWWKEEAVVVELSELHPLEPPEVRSVGGCEAAAAALRTAIAELPVCERHSRWLSKALAGWVPTFG